jgi:hypothetical protein
MAGLAVAFFIAGNKVMVEIVEHTLKNPKTGQWSRKNVTSAASFIFSITYSLVGSFWADKQVHEFIVLSFIGLTASLLGISSWEKANVVKAAAKKESDDADREAAN